MASLAIFIDGFPKSDFKVFPHADSFLLTNWSINLLPVGEIPKMGMNRKFEGQVCPLIPAPIAIGAGEPSSTPTCYPEKQNCPLLHEAPKNMANPKNSDEIPGLYPTLQNPGTSHSFRGNIFT
ncbi:MAG: hypothetical protein OEV66_04615 [Spirochaetia bacterium]|nr:hypothetical protein [Spirochaetia bacterium]